MLVSDYIVSFLIEKKISDVFGYPGGMVTYLMDSFSKYKQDINAHVAYHEQGAAFCACGYAQVSGVPGVAFATSGPGATNLITGIANAYFDSIPCIFITGQVNTYEAKNEMPIRQKGFQETDIVDMVKCVTKYAIKIQNPEEVQDELEKAFEIAVTGRKGPVLLDIPMNVQRAEINIKKQNKKVLLVQDDNVDLVTKVDMIFEALYKAKKPLIVVGAGVRQNDLIDNFRSLINKLGIPVVSSMIAVDCLSTDSQYNLGFIGAYGSRAANFAIAKSDCIISLGSRLDVRQTGSDRKRFVDGAVVIRVDVDKNEFLNDIGDTTINLMADLKELLPYMIKDMRIENQRWNPWVEECKNLKNTFSGYDDRYENIVVRKISENVPHDATITTDVGQNQVWVAQSFFINKNQKVLFSGGHGAMGYSLPAAIGAYFGTQKPVICFCGDGGFQMNIQELQFIIREKLPIKIVLLNNKSLGMIRHFQEMYFNSNYIQTTSQKGYTTPDFLKIAEAYGFDTYHIKLNQELNFLKNVFSNALPAFIEVECNCDTYVYPKLAINKPIYDQDPLIDRQLFNKIMGI